jgi:protease-4
MKQFLKFMLASIVGTFVTLFLLFFILIVVIGGAISSAMGDFDPSKKVTKVKDNTVLHIELDQPIVDRGPEDQFTFEFGGFNSSSAIGLNQILDNIEKAKDDEKITGIFLDLSVIMGGMATVDEIRDALIDFKESGKWIVSYSEMYTQKAYYLASVSDEIYAYPEGVVDFRGLSTNLSFLKGMLEKLEIEPQIIRGSNNKFKSAVEPLIMDEMSQANRLQTMKWMGSIWDNMLAEISDSRNLTPENLNGLANDFAIQEPSDAVEAGLITGTKYYDEILEILRTKTETAQDEEINFVKLSKYLKAPKPNTSETFVPSYKKNKIAVIYASGSIAGGNAVDESIGSEAFAKAVRDARLDTTVKAIVLRVNSPGGSALASDVIWRETVLAKAEKPIVVSMGDVAASGGYYISTAANEIFATPNTITGSIGVFGVIPNMQGFFNNKIGMTFDGVKTTKYADFAEVTRPLTADEFSIIQQSVDRIYDDFITKVGEGRNLSKQTVDSIGQGRVWSGSDAMEIGLIDSFGGLEDAIDRAAELAEVDDFITKDYPERKDPFQKLIEDLNAQVSYSILTEIVGLDQQMIREFQKVKAIREMKGIQAAMPIVPEL